MLLFAALTLFLTSATAVSVMGVRVSDISVVLFLIAILFFIKKNHSKKEFIDLKNSIIAGLLLCSILLSTVSQLYFGSNSFVINGISNAISIPLGIIIAFFILPRIDKNDQLDIIYKYNLIAILVCLALYFYQSFFGALTWIELIDETNRYSALSLNPNQLALYLLPIPFFVYIQHMLGGIGIRFAALQISLVLLINYFAFGKGLFTAWFVGFAVFLLLGSYGKINKKILAIKMIFFTLLMPLIYFILSPLIVALYTGDAPGSMEGQGDLRVHLWLNGLRAWSDAPFLGNGPGHYSGLDLAYEGVESHNLLIDWLSAYGLIGAIALIALFFNAIRQSIKLNVWIVLGFNLCLLTQSVFHFYGRQPIYWIWWAVGLAAANALMQRKEIKCVG
jgi:O-antigen ligase